MREKRRFEGTRSIIVTVVSFLLFINTSSLRTSLGDVIDQRWERPSSSYPWGSWSIKNNYPLGQEFTAGMNNIVGVELSIRDCGSEPSGIATIDVKIRNDTIQGSALISGTNTFESLSGEWLYFDFGRSVPLSVGNRYVIEVSTPNGAQYWAWNCWNDADKIGLPGRMIISGQFLDSDFAFGFRTYAIPEPGTILLLGLGSALLRSKKSKGKR